MVGLTPGSPAAMEKGCKCGPMDNGYGRGCGMINDEGTPVFWINGDCPLHGRSYSTTATTIPKADEGAEG